MSDRVDFNDAVLYGPDESLFGEAEEVCSVCLEPLGDQFISTTCRHDFHYRCLRSYIDHCEDNQDITCPLCRSLFSHRWLTQTGLQRRISSRQYWAQVEDSFGPAPIIGPLIPSHQRQYDVSEGFAAQLPVRWSRQWIEDRQAEMRIRFNIDPSFRLTANDVSICEATGMLGIFPEWSMPSWYHPIFSDSDSD